MAREPEEREDLLGTATALVERIELRIDAQQVFVGFREDGAASLYLDDEPVYHFNSRGELRRAYVEGNLLKAVEHQLVTMRRQHVGTAVQMVSRSLAPDEQASLLAALAKQLTQLQQQLATGQYEIIGQVPPDAPLTERIARWLAGLAHPVAIAAQPHAL